MNDISRIVDEMCAWLEAAEARSVPTLPTSAEGRGNAQVYDIAGNSHTSRSSHTQNEASVKNDYAPPRNATISAEASRVTSSYAGDVGSVGSVGSGAKTLAGSTHLPFPQDLKNVGSVGTDDGLCGPSLPALSPSDPLPISPADVRAGVARELRALAEDGREGPAALRDAVEITRAKIRNSEALAERQAHGGRCHACDGPLDDSAPVVAVLSGKRGAPLFLHAGCCGAYTARRVALVDRIMAAAGYGAEAKGAAA